MSNTAPKLKTLQPRLKEIGPQFATLGAVSWRTGKGKTAERGYGGRWRRARLEHLRKHPLCVHCEGEGRVRAATVVDHRTPHRGDEKLFWDRSNWQSLCATCHSSVKQRQEARASAGDGLRAGGWDRGGTRKIPGDPRP